MYRPSPPPAINAASVAVATTCTAEMRMPVTMTGAASGSSSRPKICVPRMPIPFAASTVSASTPLIPTYVFVRIGGIARSVSATTVGTNPNASPGHHRSIRMNTSTRIANDGMARPRFAIGTATPAPRRVCPTTAPIGIAISTAIATATTHISMCWSRRIGMPFSPDQCSDARSHWSTLTTRLPRRDDPSPRASSLAAP